MVKRKEKKGPYQSSGGVAMWKKKKSGGFGEGREARVRGNRREDTEISPYPFLFLFSHHFTGMACALGSNFLSRPGSSSHCLLAFPLLLLFVTKTLKSDLSCSSHLSPFDSSIKIRIMYTKMFTVLFFMFENVEMSFCQSCYLYSCAV